MPEYNEEMEGDNKPVAKDEIEFNFKHPMIREWKHNFSAYFDWPPSNSSLGKGTNDHMAKEGKSPMEIWEVHSNEILENHKQLKEFHENILSEFERSREDGTTMEFWEKYWKNTYNMKLPNPVEMEERWGSWVGNGNPQDKFWDNERKKFKQENGWSFWKNKASCQERVGHKSGTLRHRCDKSRITKWLSCKPVSEEKALFKMFDF